MATPAEIIAQVAQQVAAAYGFDTQQAQELQAISLATAQQESGFDPQAVGDNGTSFGLFQLHQGGELGSLTEQQAFDPRTNAQVAIPEIAQVLQQNPAWSPGQIAAAAQRPADQTAYAKDINGLYPQYAGGQLPGGGGNKLLSSNSSDQLTLLQLPLGQKVTVSKSGVIQGASNVGAVVVGAALLLIGVVVVVRPHLPKTTPVPVPVPL